MGENFAQTASPVAILRSILAGYPFSIGLFQEIIQNSEDAGAKVQVFVLDRRLHHTEGLYHQNLAAAQGPALLAFNDAYFTEKDWEALRRAYESSKLSDSSKIGKFGVGFRSLFHLTDCPQIMSGDLFVVFDPLKTFTGTEGKRIDIAQLLADYPGQLSSFKYFQDMLEGSRFKGTVVRCPLRTAKASGISSEIVKPGRLCDLLSDFGKTSLELSLLFLRNLEKVTIIDIDEAGITRTLASLDFTRSNVQHISEHCHFRSATAVVVHSGTSNIKSWNVITCPFSGEQANRILAKAVDEDVDLEPVLQEHKLRPHISIAALSDLTKTRGRFFTYLPLPIFSSFGIHINAVFALTSSRQHLLNSHDFGVARNSGDHILREWNKTLFDDFIPRAWKEYLEYLVRQGNITPQSLFDAWPTLASHDWKNVPLHVFENVVASNSAIWPLLGKPNISIVFKPLHDILIAKQTEKKVAEALSTMGLEITSPPAYIFDFVAQSSHFPELDVLSPEGAHDGLLQNIQHFPGASADTMRVILDYLLSTSKCLNLVGLPIIPTSAASGTRLSLQPAGTTTEIHTLLDSAQARIFGTCDDRSISISSLPPRAGSVLLDKGPGVLNLEKLTNERIITYLKRHLANMGPNIADTIPNRDNLTWVSGFWEWFGTWGDRYALRQMIEADGLTLMPCTQGLKPLANPVFKAKGMQPLPVRQLSTFGIAFVHSELSARAHDQLASLGLLKQISNIHDLLDALPSADSLVQPSPETCNGVLRHLSAYATASCDNHGVFSPAQIEKLKSLPIYPVVSETMGGAGTVARSFKAIPAGATVRPVRRPPFLPTVSDVVFVEVDLLGPLLRFITSSADRLDDNALLSLSCDHLIEQTTQFQAFALNYIVKRQGNIPPQIRDNLADIAFVVSESGSLVKPGDLVDPTSPIACLFADDPSIQPQLQTEFQRLMIDSLRKLKFLKSALTPALIADRATHISRHHASEHALVMAHNLLRALCAVQYIDLSTMPPEILSMKWLPTTDRGLQSPVGTRDDRPDAPRHLFDCVLAVLQPEFNPVSAFLRHYFGWDVPLPFETLVQQFKFVMDTSDPERNGADIFKTVSDILDKLSYLQESFDTDTLKDMLKEQRWVPTTAGTLVSVHDAVFEVPSANSGFSQIGVRPSTKDLLLHLGCMDSPNTSAILLKFKFFKDLPPCLENVKTAVILLSCLPEEMLESEPEAILIPDTDMVLQPLSQIRFNDIGDNAVLIPNHGPLAHPLVTDAIAKKLGLENLGMQYADLVTSNVQMGVNTLVQVQNVLKAYTEGQFLTEFVANAVDAGATSFKISVNEGVPASTVRPQVLSPSSMQGLAEAPTMVVYNNSVFTDLDFRGICETSVGGKGGQTGTIGQFGLGAATMFYFTEMALVVSGRFVLFLNPSGECLPGRRTALRLPLDHVKRCYADHLRQANGQFGFSTENEDDEYIGTLFILPLRTVTQLDSSTHNMFSQTKIWDREMIVNDVIKPFATSAPNCLLFTTLSNISAVGYWDFTAEHDAVVGPEEGTGYLVHDVQISAENNYNPSLWRVACITIPRSEIPPRVPRVSSRIRDPVAGLAARLSGEGTDRQHSFFSTLPLRIPTSVPVHVMASFILSSDRRNIRLDEYDNSETAYNRWLLEELLPPLYLFLLEKLATDQNVPSNKLRHWWPGYREAADNISRHLIKPFYDQHLGSSLRRIFVGEFDDPHSQHRQPFTPSEVVLTGDEPSIVHTVLARLQSSRVVKLSGGARKRALNEAKLSPVNPSFLREEIRDKLGLFRSLFQLSHDKERGDEEDMFLNLEDLEQIILYLNDDLQPDADSPLEGLAILPLSNDDFGTFTVPSSSQTYYSMPKQQNTVHAIPHRFSQSKFVHPRLKHKEMLKLGLNIIKPTADDLVTLLSEQVPQTAVLEHPPGDLVEWIIGSLEGENHSLGFWDYFGGYQQLGLTHKHIQDFPLVPTIQPHVFVSLANCREGAALVLNLNLSDIEDPNGRLLRHAFIQLELNVVERNSLMMIPSLHAILESQEFMTMHPLLKVVKTFENKTLEQIGADFGEVGDEAACQTFAQWVYDAIDHAFVFNGLPGDPPLLYVARLLPIWPSVSQEERQIRLCPASEVHLLPPGMKITHAVPYIKTRISEHPSLHHLQGPRYEYTDIPNILDLPDRLEDTDLSHYHNFLQTWLYQLPSADPPIPILVPNTTGQMCDCATLFSRTPLFLAAYGEDADVFVSPLFSNLENKLSGHGLKTEDQLDMDVFRDCVNVIDRTADNHQRVARASRIFKVFCDQMSVLALQSGVPDVLRQFDDYSFIPRNMTIRRRRLPGIESELIIRVANLGDDPPARVLRPRELVREEFEAVAWSQRALFDEQPGPRILSVYPGLGKPSLTEVVLHLEYLSSLDPGNGTDRKIIKHDAKASYNFLMKNLPTTDGQDVNIQDSFPHDVHERAIFLNINEEQTDNASWTWRKGSELVFNASDGGMLFSVKSFLKDFQTLLSQVGAACVHRPTAKRSVVVAPAGHLKAFKEGFDGFRQSRKFVDVCFEAQAGGDEDSPVLQFWAHRSFLSVSSTYFAEMFTADMMESRNGASHVFPVVLPGGEADDRTRYDPCIGHVLDYIYSSTPWLPQGTLNTLLEMLEIAHLWDLGELVNLVQEEIVNEKMIEPDTVDAIEEIADSLHAALLLEKCAEFKELNQDYIARIMSQTPTQP